MSDSLNQCNDSILAERESFFAKLGKFIEHPLIYPSFPTIPHYISELINSGKSDQFSIYKKGKSYFIVDDGKGEFHDTLKDISGMNIIFACTQFELDMQHIGAEVWDILEAQNKETELYEICLNQLLMGNKTPLNLSGELSRKVNDLFYEVDLGEKIPDRIESFTAPIHLLERVTLFVKQGYYFVLHTDIFFTKDELEQIKKLS